MLLRRKVDRAMKWSRDRSLQAEGIDLSLIHISEPTRP